MGLALAKIEMTWCASLQALALGRQRSRYLRYAHFITSSEKGLGELNGWVKSGTILNQTVSEVKNILSGHPSDNVS